MWNAHSGQLQSRLFMIVIEITFNCNDNTSSNSSNIIITTMVITSHNINTSNWVVIDCIYIIKLSVIRILIFKLHSNFSVFYDSHTSVSCRGVCVICITVWDVNVITVWLLAYIASSSAVLHNKKQPSTLKSSTVALAWGSASQTPYTPKPSTCRPMADLIQKPKRTAQRPSLCANGLALVLTA